MTLEMRKLKEQLENLYLKEGLTERVINISQRLDILILKAQREKLSK